MKTKKLKPDEKNLGSVVDFLYEVGVLSKTPRSFPAFLGSGSQSVADHINRTVYVGYCLAHINKKADVGKVVMLIQFHDVSEARISDLNHVHQKYTTRKEHEAENDMTKNLPFGGHIQSLLDEYHDRKTIEAKLAKDADNLEFLLTLKEQADTGNERALAWIPSILQRLITEEGKEMANIIVETDSDRWWFGDKDDNWWINRNK